MSSRRPPPEWRGTSSAEAENQHRMLSADSVFLDASARKTLCYCSEQKVPSFGDVLSRRNQVEASAPTVLLREGGPLVFEGWSDDSGTLFVYKKETKPSSSEHVSRSACHSGEKCVLTRHSDKHAEPPSSSQPPPPQQDGYSAPGLTGN